MRTLRNYLALLATASLLLASQARAADSLLDSLKKGTPELKSAGTLTFGPEGILFVADTQAATIYALDTGDRTAAKGKDLPKVEGINDKLASLLGVEAKELLINDMSVNPISGNTYLSLSRGKGADAKPAIVRVDRASKITELSLKDVGFAKVTIPNASEKQRKDAVTDMAYVKGKLFVAGMSNEDFSSNLRVIPFPFKDADNGTKSVEIWHGAHGGFETKAPVRTFVPYDIKGETHLLAAYQCTPLVKFPVAEVKPGEKVKGVTVAELGSGNRPIDMIVYKKDGKEFLLLANSARGVMKIPTEGIGEAKPVTEKIGGGNTAGIKYETIKELKGVEHLDKLDDGHAILLVKTDKGMNLETIDLP
jgi:hypothetical protein